MRFTLTAIAFTLMLAARVQGEGVAVGRDGVTLSGFGEVDPDKTVQHWADREQTDIKTRLNLQIELLTDACELGEANVKKLRLAAQTITARRIAAGREQVMRFLYDSSLVTADEELPEARVRSRDDVWLPYGAGNLNNGIVEFKGEFSTPLLEHPLWVKVLRSSLSDAQMKKYEDLRKQRNRALLSTAISMALSEMDQQIYLSEKQIRDIHAHALDSLGSEVTSKSPASLREANSMTRIMFRDADVFKPFLRSTQIERLQFIRDNKVRSSVGWGSPTR